MKFILYKKGFSLVELMVVIAIIGILTSIVTANFAQSKAKARDAKRVSDIAQLQLTLEMIFDRCNTYPSSPLNLSTTVCTDTSVPPVNYSLGSFMSKPPTPPTTAAGDTYDYITNGTDYVLRSTLETNSSSLTDDIDGNPLGTTGGYCDDTAPNYYYCVQPK